MRCSFLTCLFLVFALSLNCDFVYSQDDHVDVGKASSDLDPPNEDAEPIPPVVVVKGKEGVPIPPVVIIEDKRVPVTDGQPRTDETEDEKKSRFTFLNPLVRGVNRVYDEILRCWNYVIGYFKQSSASTFEVLSDGLSSTIENIVKFFTCCKNSISNMFSYGFRDVFPTAASLENLFQPFLAALVSVLLCYVGFSQPTPAYVGDVRHTPAQYRRPPVSRLSAPRPARGSARPSVSPAAGRLNTTQVQPGSSRVSAHSSRSATPIKPPSSLSTGPSSPVGASTSTPSFDEEELNNRTVKQLNALCQEYGLPTSGLKNEKIQRILKHLS